MYEDRLSPELGRLIDEAKAAARLLGADTLKAEGVALLTGGGTIHSGATTPGAGAGQGAAGAHGAGAASGTGAGPIDPPGAGAGRPPLSAAELALGRARKAGDDEILAAAVAVPGAPAETVLPSAESHRCLMGIDPELPLVVKRQGRWVVLPASQVRPPS
jgi:hypothetical protein